MKRSYFVLERMALWKIDYGAQGLGQGELLGGYCNSTGERYDGGSDQCCRSGMVRMDPILHIF